MEKTKAISKTILFPLEITLSVLAFAIPFLVSGPQWLTGTLVNSFLIIFISRSTNKNILPIITLPSIGAFLHGVVFGPLTPFLFYFLPFIWIGNYLLLTIFQILSMKRINFFISIFVSSIFKSSFLFLSAVVFFQLKIVPQIFLKTMGIFQLTTACFGGIVAYFVMKFINKNYDRT